MELLSWIPVAAAIAMLIWELNLDLLSVYASVVYDRALIQKVVAEILIKSLLRLGLGISITLLLFRIIPSLATMQLTLTLVFYGPVYGLANLAIAVLLHYQDRTTAIGKKMHTYLHPRAQVKFTEQYNRWYAEFVKTHPKRPNC